MGKEKKPKLSIKTARYFTKACTSCGGEYPNWFTNCPKCGVAWDNIESRGPSTIQEVAKKKTIKIVVAITEEDFEEAIEKVQLIFSADQGKSWFQMRMDIKMDYFIAEIAEVPVGSIIIYYVEVYLINDEKIIENNDGKYFYYKVGAPITDIQEEPPTTEVPIIQENIEQSSMIPKNYTDTKKEGSSSGVDDDDLTIFGKPQTMLDPNLKVCPHCQSKIKQLWTVCPICGKSVV